MPPQLDPTPADREAGWKFREALKDRADGWIYGGPYWYGWAVMDAFLAGILHERERAAKVAEVVGEDTARQVGDGFPGAPSYWGIHRAIAAAIRRGPG